jgi:lysozyme
MDLDRLSAELTRDEGVVPYAYTDSLGYLTIGVGRLIDKRRGGRLRADEIALMLKNDIDEKALELDAKLGWWRKLDPVRQRVLANMAFNLGTDGLLKFKNTLAAVQAGRWSDAADGMLQSLWAKQVGQRARRLAEMMLTGEEPHA